MAERSSILHLPTLHELAADVGRDAVGVMIDLFVDSLPTRIHRLRQAVGAGNMQEAHVAALSLSCSAAMLGATQLSETAVSYARGPREDAEALNTLVTLSDRELREVRRHLVA